MFLRKLIQDIGEDTELTYYQWTATNTKELVQSTHDKAVQELVSQLIMLRRHTFFAKIQQQQIKELKTKLSEDEIILQEDFSENFVIKQQDEIMSAHWLSNSVTLFTATINRREQCESYVVVSDELHHDKFAVFCYNQMTLKEAGSRGCIKKTANIHRWCWKSVQKSIYPLNYP